MLYTTHIGFAWGLALRMLVPLLFTEASYAQTATDAVSAEAFTSENAILDTSILFAIGAREAQQDLRGSFGWPSFQEGLVEGVYFRFDPDGYARFSPTPRLDSDVFEVICRPRTLSCMGRKQSMSVILTGQGQLQLKIDDVVEGDTFFVAEGVSELQIPDRILMPLEPRLEALLSTGGEMVVRRGETEVTRISLAGFSAVSSYLRWIVARQDYTVLPRGWPVPNATGGADPAGLTQSVAWASPMPQPQLPLLQQDVAAMIPAAGVTTEVAEVRAELDILRDILIERAATATIPTALVADNLNGTTRLVELERAAAAMQQEIDGLRTPTTPAVTAPTPEMALLQNPDDVLAQRLAYLITEIGLDPKTAVMLLQIDTSTPAIQPDATSETLYQDQLVNQILSGMPPQSVPGLPSTAVNPQDFQLLTDYFQSVVLPTAALPPN